MRENIGDNMQIRVKFFGPQRLETNLEKYDIQCEDGMRVIDVIDFLKMRFNKISFGEIIFVNGVKSNIQTKLKHMDEVMFLPSIGGG